MTSSQPRLRRALAPAASLLALGVAVTAVLAQPGDILYPRTCNAGQCVASGFTLALCDRSTDVGCCCKFSGQQEWKCQCTDEVTCLTSPDCHTNSEQ